MSTLTAYVSWDEESRMFFGAVPGIRGAHTQAPTLEEFQWNLKEVLELCVAEGELERGDIPKFVGLQQIEVSV